MEYRFGNIDLEMDMVFSEAEFTELKTKTFQVSKRLNAGVYVGLFSETVVSTFGVKFHGYPIISCVMRWFFISIRYLHFSYCFLLLSHRL